MFSSLLQYARNLWNHAYAIGMRLSHQHVYLLAAGVAFNVVLCTIPLLSLVIFIAWWIIPPEQLTAIVMSAIADALPPTQQVQSLINTILVEAERVRTYATAATVVASVILLWTASTLLSSLRTALNAIFSIPETRWYIWYKLRDMLLTVVLVIVVIIMLLLTPALSVLSSHLTTLTPWLEHVHITWWISFATHVGSSFILIFLLFHFVPSIPQPLFIIVRASLVSVGLWEVARVAFTFYIEHAKTLGAIYGAFSLVVIAGLWVYYTALIVLASAEVAQYWWEHHALKT